MKTLAVTAALFAVIAVANAETPAPAAPPPAPVETLTCDQMHAEMMVAGRRMQAQLDPQFAVEAQRQYEQMKGRSAPKNPGAAAEVNRAAKTQQAQRITQAMDGIDMQRMQAIGERFQKEKCVPPQPTQPPPGTPQG